MMGKPKKKPKHRCRFDRCELTGILVDPDYCKEWHPKVCACGRKKEGVGK